MNSINENSVSKKITLYNHKGGVGKTILTANIASSLAEMGKKVLIVDSDPQANLTSFFIEDSVVDDLLDKSDTSNGRTLWSALKPLVTGEGTYKKIEPYETTVNNLLLLPGDIRLAEFEISLSDFWRESLERRVRGYSGTNSLSSFVNSCITDYDIEYVFYDTGPNIGPLNRIILLDCDYFIIPVAYDLFSRRALKTLGYSLVTWIKDWKTITQLAPPDTYLMKGNPKFLGYIPQRFKVYGGKITRSSSSYTAQIEKSIHSDIVSTLRELDGANVSKLRKTLKLGEVKDYSSLVQLAQKQGVPLKDVSGAIDTQKNEAMRTFEKIAVNINDRTNLF